MSDLEELKVRSRPFPETGSSLVASGFEASSIPCWWGWRNSAPDRLRVKEVHSVMSIALALYRNPFAYRHHLLDFHETGEVGRWYHPGAWVPTMESSSNHPWG